MRGLILHQQQEEEPRPGVCFPEGASKAREAQKTLQQFLLLVPSLCWAKGFLV